MRIALVAGVVGGGVLAHVRSTATAFVAAGHQVVVAAPHEVLGRIGVGEPLPVRIGERPDPVADARTVRTLRGLRSRVDIVHAHGVRAGALSALARPDAPLVTTLHNAAPTGSALTAGMFGLLLRVAARGSAVVLCVSPDLESVASRAGAHEVRRAVIAAPGATAPVREHAGVRVVSVGRLSAQKRMDLLIDTASLVGGGLTWEVAGDGPDRIALQEQIDRTGAPVRLLGRRDDVPELLGGGDIAVSTAVWEGQPVWLQEAVRAGLPVVAFDVGGIRDTVGAAGVYLPFPDVRALAGEVRRLATDATYRADRAASARRVARTLPTERDQADALIALYGSLAPSLMS